MEARKLKYFSLSTILYLFIASLFLVSIITILEELYPEHIDIDSRCGLGKDQMFGLKGNKYECIKKPIPTFWTLHATWIYLVGLIATHLVEVVHIVIIQLY